MKRVQDMRVIQPVWGQRDKCGALCNKPEFKPGKKMWVKFGNEYLNHWVNWQKTTQDIIDAGYGLQALAQEMKLTCEDIEKVLSGDISPLNFKLGARLLRIEEEIFPERHKY